MRYPLLYGIICTATLLCIPLKTQASVESIPLHLTAHRTITQKLTDPVTGIAISFGDATTSVKVQFMEENTWSEWQLFKVDDDTNPWERDSSLLFTSDATSIRLRSDSDTNITLHAISVDRGPDTWSVAAAGRTLTAAPIIIPRWQWLGSKDEDLRKSPRGAAGKERAFYNTPDLVRRCSRRAYLYPEEFREKHRKFTEDLDGDGEEDFLLWPIGYSDKINSIIIHHTAESSPRSTSRSDAERIRTIYAYHAKARGWGDIGYNFVIGTNGTIFEGRAGGAYAVGAHAYCNNVGSMGISLMGNFQTEKPTDVQLTALRWLLVHLTDTYDIDPETTTIFHGKKMPMIIGHNDVGVTACPGIYSKELLPQLRVAAKDRSINSPLFSTAAKPSQQNEAAPMSSLLPLSVSMGERNILTVRYMNVGLETWNKDTWLLAKGDKGVYFPHIRPYSFVAATIKEQFVPPGEIATFKVNIQGGLSKKNGYITFTPVINNERRLINNTTTLAFNTESAAPRITHVTSYFPSLHKTGEDLTGTIKVVNSGTVPWEENTITELTFDLKGGTGEITILDAPKNVLPGKQGSFRVRLQNVEESGQYERSLIPRFLEGTPLVGGAIVISSRAEPIPEIAYITGHNAAFTEPLPHSRGRSTKAGGAVLEALGGLILTLSPREQSVIKLRIRTGKVSIRRLETIAPIVRSNPLIILQDQESSLRMRSVLRSPFSLKPYQAEEMDLLLIAPRREGEYTLSIGNMTFQLIVRAHGRSTAIKTAQKSESKILTRRAPMQTLLERRRALRLERLSRRAPPKSRIEKRSDIRIRLSYDKSTAILTSPSSVRIDGKSGIIFESGPIHLSKEQSQCKIVTGNGSFRENIIRLTPTDERGFITIMTDNKSTNQFRGTLECRIINDKLTLINELDIEDYLAGLAEEPDSEPWEKQRAFAIAARSYALFYILSGQRKFPGMPFDGSDSPREFQAYGGLYFETKNPRWVDAVKDTAGRVLTWQRKIVKAPYFSNDSGKTNSAYDVWGWTHTPYLDSKPDPWCKGMSPAGHGVGMSGCGSEGQANEGKTAEEILDYYYPGTNVLPLEKVYEWEKRMGG